MELLTTASITQLLTISPYMRPNQLPPSINISRSAPARLQTTTTRPETSNEPQDFPQEESDHQLDIPRISSPITHGSRPLNIGDIPRIKTPNNALAVLRDLRVEDLTADPEMIDALVVQFSRVVAPGDPGLLKNLCEKLLTLAASDHRALDCVLACFHQRPDISAIFKQHLLSPQLAALAVDDGIFIYEQNDATNKATSSNVPPSNTIVLSEVESIELTPIHRLPKPDEIIVLPEGGSIELTLIHRPPKPDEKTIDIIWDFSSPTWDRSLTGEILDFTIPNSLSFDAPEILKEKGRRTLDLMRLSKEILEKCGGKKSNLARRLNDLRWMYSLTRLRSSESSFLLEADVFRLIDDQSLLSTLPQAKSRRILALMITKQEVLEDLCNELRSRVDLGQTDSMLHIDWQRLPAHAMLVACLTSAPEKFNAFAIKILSEWSPSFSHEVHEQIKADIYAFYLLSASDEVANNKMKSDLKMEELKSHLKDKIKHLETLRMMYFSAVVLDLEYFIALGEALPSPGEDWNLFAVITLWIMGDAYGKGKLPSGIIPKIEDQTLQMFLVGKIAEMIRYFMSLTSPGQPQIFTRAGGHFQSPLLGAAFLQLSMEEKIGFLTNAPISYAVYVIEMIASDEVLAPVGSPERIKLIDELIEGGKLDGKLLKKLRKVLLEA